ncbi:MAG: SEC-C metal-binding domain-containing protein, partial [Plesiomonas sp.]
ANDQRKAIYEQRNELLDADEVGATIDAIRDDVVGAVIDQYIPPQSLEEMWDVPGLEHRLHNDFDLTLPIGQWLEEDNNLHEEVLRERIQAEALKLYREKEDVVGESMMRHFEKGVMLQTLDTLWKEHLAAMDHLRQGIHLRGYAQKNPKQEYKRESFEMFTEMLETLKLDVISTLSKVRVRMPEEVEQVDVQRRVEAERIAQKQQYSHSEVESALTENSDGSGSLVRAERKVGRNELCPCGSGKKYKQCHGVLQG